VVPLFITDLVGGHADQSLGIYIAPMKSVIYCMIWHRSLDDWKMGTQLVKCQSTKAFTK
jgi:hypothetical protein